MVGGYRLASMLQRDAFHLNRKSISQLFSHTENSELGKISFTPFLALLFAQAGLKLPQHKHGVGSEGSCGGVSETCYLLSRANGVCTVCV